MADKQPDYKVVRCPNAKCNIPFLRIYKDGRRSILKWYEGRMHETFIQGLYGLTCFNCKKEIYIPHDFNFKNL